MAEFFNIKDITKIDFNKLVRMLPGGNLWNPFGTQGRYIKAIVRSQKVFLDNNIDSALRIAHFIGQGLIETGYLRHKAENLNYSAEGLMKTFPKYFDGIEEARKFDRKPEKIANRVYANRMGNGDEASGDGWRYRGRGFIQLTGKNNYRYHSELSGIDLVKNPDILEKDLRKSIAVAAAFFNKNGLLSYADQNDGRAVSRGVNRGDPNSRVKAHGEADRLILTQQVLDLVRNPGKIDRGSKEFETSRADLPDRPDGLTVGDRGSEVKDIQEALNLLGYSAGAEDGVFGQNTERAVVNFQRENGLDVTGAVNEETMKALDEALNDTRDSLPPSRMEGNANDAAKAGTKQINQSRQVGNTGAAVGGAGAAGAAAEGGIVEEVIERVIPDEEDDDTPPQDDEPADTSGQGEESSQEPPAEELPTTDEADVEPESAPEPALPETEEPAADTEPETAVVDEPDTDDVTLSDDSVEEEEEAETGDVGDEQPIEDTDSAELPALAEAPVAPEGTEEAQEDSEVVAEADDLPLEDDVPPEEITDTAPPSEEPPAPEPAPSEDVDETPLPSIADAADKPEPLETPAAKTVETIEVAPAPRSTTEQVDDGPNMVVVIALILIAIMGLYIFVRSRRTARNELDAWKTNRIR